jgi:hypothetical protein
MRRQLVIAAGVGVLLLLGGASTGLRQDASSDGIIPATRIRHVLRLRESPEGRYREAVLNGPRVTPTRVAPATLKTGPER